MLNVVAVVLLRHDSFTLTLLGVALVIVVARLAGLIFEKLRQPPVIGEVIAGLALGPSVLGDYSFTIFPPEGRPLLKVLATLGLVIFMFLIGLELDLAHLVGRRRVAIAVASAGTVIPFVLGVLLAFVLYSRHSTTDFPAFAVFIGAAMSITAFPVLVRILKERGLYHRPLGVVATASAALDDVTTWATLAVVLAFVASSGAWDLPYIAATSLAFAGVMTRLVGPALARFGDRQLDPVALSMVVAAILTASWVTSTTGTHEIFGAFLLGAVFPRGRLADSVAEQLGSFTHVLLPVFFVTTGLNVDVGDVGGDGLWQFALILVVACGGKVVGGAVGAYAQGIPLRESLAFGVIINTRGLTELVVLNIGRDLGILDDTLFTLLVGMAVVTTVMTGPLLGLLRPDPDLSIRREGRKARQVRSTRRRDRRAPPPGAGARPDAHL